VCAHYSNLDSGSWLMVDEGENTSLKYQRMAQDPLDVSELLVIMAKWSKMGLSDKKVCF